MPLYDYECPDCGHSVERVFTVKGKPERIGCGECGNAMNSVIIHGHGGIQTETPKWLGKDVNDAILGDDDRPVATRTEYNKILKDRKIEPIERGHRGRRMI